MMMKYSDDGVLIETWVVHSLGAAARNGRTKFRTISLSLSQDLQFLYVVNSRENKIQKYTLDGTFVTEWGGKRESASDALRSSQGVSVNSRGEVIVADTDNERLQIFSSDGEFIREIRGPHSELKGVFHPKDVDVNLKTGDIYVVSSYSHRLDI